MRALLGRVVLACETRLEEATLLDEIVTDGKVLPLSFEQEAAVSDLLLPPLKSFTKPDSEDGISLEGFRPSIAKSQSEQPPAMPAMPAGHVSRTEGGLKSAFLVPFRAVDRFLLAMVGYENTLLHNFLRIATFAALILLAGWFAKAWLTSVKTPIPGPNEPSIPIALEPLHLRPIPPQTIEAGKLLTVAVSVENADVWKRKVRYNLGRQAPPGATLDAKSGIFSWTPPSDQTPGKSDVTVLAAGPEGQTDQTSLLVNVVPALRLAKIAPQTIAAGKKLAVKVPVEDAKWWEGRLRFSLGSNAPPGTQIDPKTGVFNWTPPLDQAAGEYEVIVYVDASGSQYGQGTFTIRVIRPPRALKKEIAFDLGSGVSLEMILIPAGEFMMGSPDSDKDALDWEKPQHRVRITKPFYLGKYLVTQEQWQAVMGNNPSNFRGPTNPVEQVSWKDCQEFVEKLNAKVGGGRFSLPTEAQWEYACRAGNTTRYCYGDDESRLGEYAWYDGNSGRKTHPVGEKKPNAWGLYDMHGNVFEWCMDWYGGYAKSPADDPAVSSGDMGRVNRGGGWSSYAAHCRSGFRTNDAGLRSSLVGFRVARVPTGQAAERPTPEFTAPLKIQPISPQTIEVGKRLAVVVSVEDASQWKGKLRFSLAPNAPLGAKIDPETGAFTWTPAEDPGPGEYDVAVSVEGLDGQKNQASLHITVTRPTPPPGKEVTFDLSGGVTLNLVLIPAGSFMMGDEKGYNNEKPVHKVTITKPFYLGKYPVTQEQWEAVMDNNPSCFKGATNPVERVSWYECQAFLQKLNQKFGVQAGRFQLPTEAQWEYACRAGSTTRYCFGDDDTVSGQERAILAGKTAHIGPFIVETQLGVYAWYNANSGETTYPVGQKKPNGWGLFDMHGNVWEWSADRYDSSYYAASPADDPLGPASGWDYVARGGGWGSIAGNCRSAVRNHARPGSLVTTWASAFAELQRSRNCKKSKHGLKKKRCREPTLARCLPLEPNTKCLPERTPPDPRRVPAGFCGAAVGATSHRAAVPRIGTSFRCRLTISRLALAWHAS